MFSVVLGFRHIKILSFISTHVIAYLTESRFKDIKSQKVRKWPPAVLVDSAVTGTEILGTVASRHLFLERRR